MKFDILNRFMGAVQFTAEIDCDDAVTQSVKVGLAVKWAVKSGADLRGANLHGADLYGANLRGANLHGANLRGADLYGANLRGAKLRRANLHGANLYGANLYWANLYWANLRGAYLRGANLRGADLYGADLYGADLRGANLHGANLHGANLHGANLYGAEDIPAFVGAQTIIVSEGQIIGWKKCRNGVIVKISIPAEARRSNATGRKCRAEYADVLDVIGAEVGVSQHDGTTEYRVGQRVACDKWCEDRWQECAGGIHFFLTREEAEAY